MSKEINEEKHFTLNAMKFVFQVCGSYFPYKYQKELDDYGENHPLLLTDDMKKAIIFILGEFFDTNTSPDDIESEEYNATLRKLKSNFDLADFLKFLAWYLLISAHEKSEEKQDKVYFGIINVLKSKAPISESWSELDEIASNFIKDAEKKQRIENYESNYYNVSMREEKKFLLKLIDYIFVLHFRELPGNLDYKLKEIAIRDDYDENDPFTNNITHALAILLNNHLKVIEKIGEDGLVEYYSNKVPESFTERDYLELCVSLIRRSLDEYFVSWDDESPWRAYKRIKRVLKDEKRKGRFHSLIKMEEAALQIIDEDIARTSEEQQKEEICKSKSGVVYDEYKPLSRLSHSDRATVTRMFSNSERSIEKSLVNQEEVAFMDRLESSSKSFEETELESTLLIEDKKDTCQCCNCS